MLPVYEESYTYCSTPTGNTQIVLYRRKTTRKRKAEAIYYIKQKLSGLVMVAVGIVVPFLLDGDATFSLFAIPLGIYLIFTEEKVMMFK